MSIYPVPLKKWYSKKDDPENHRILKIMAKYDTCKECGGKIDLRRAWGHHSLPWGYGDFWCSRKCLNKK